MTALLAFGKSYQQMRNWQRKNRQQHIKRYVLSSNMWELSPDIPDEISYHVTALVTKPAYVRLVSSLDWVPDFGAEGAGFDSRPGPTLNVLNLLRTMSCLYSDIWLDFLVFSDKDDKQDVPSHA